MDQYNVIGKSIKRIDAREKVTGAAKYVDDLQFGRRTLQVKILRSPHPHARIVGIDATAALNLPGVKAVVTGRDEEVGGRMGLYLADREVYASDRVRFVGEPVAGVAAETLDIAAEALKLIHVEYEVLPGVFDPVAGARTNNSPLVHEQPSPTDLWWQGMHCLAAKPSVAPGTLLHDSLAGYSCAPFIHPVPGTNISNHFKLRKGDIAAGFDGADVIAENIFYVPHIQHCQIENHGAAALYDQAGNLTLWASSQSPNAVRKILAEGFKIPMNKIRVISSYVGGGFGGKAGVTTEGLVVPLAMKLPGYHIRLALTREETFQTTFVRQGLVAKLKTGVTKEGRIVATEVELFWDAGAYTEYGVNMTRSGGYCASGPYEIPHMKVDSYCVYTNHPVGGPMRGFAMPEIHWAIEQQMDILAEKLAIDPLEFRLRNALREGSTSAYGAPMHGATLVDTIEAVREKCGWGGPKPEPSAPHKVAGRGMACMFKAPSMPPNAQSSAVIKFNEDATVNLLTTASDIGQGAMTALAQIAAEELGIPVEWIKTNLPDTDYTPYEWQTVASRISYSAGNAVLRAARDAKSQLLDTGSQALGIAKDDAVIRDGWVSDRNNPDRRIAVVDIAMGFLTPQGAIGSPVIGRGQFVPEGLTGLDKDTGQEVGGGKGPAPFYTFGTQVADIEVDTETGEIVVKRITAAYEVGKVINWEMCVGQVQGGIIQGLSSALFEQLILENGQPRNNDFVDYKIATAGDIPAMDIILLETSPQPDGPFGAKGVAEPTMVPTAPAIANALYDALGIRIKDLPMTAEKVLAALKEKKTAEAGAG
ncbi:MAG: xanthine dehydrogenase family protein molybdopterin-binding subunit [Negativicutes bacterium]|nr:xanthine dehydrogenase family protein molybdopterin-binding subunit [Negativicutes bacterium]